MKTKSILFAVLFTILPALGSALLPPAPDRPAIPTKSPPSATRRERCW
jgi:hypothetical protein